MYQNPFSPIFGGRPTTFFGRKELLADFDAALIDPSSENRALFITGTRGSGKTALVERLSQRATTKGWHVIDLGPDHAVQTLLHSLVGHDEETRAVSPQMSVSVLGTGGSLGGISTSKTTRYDVADLTALLLDACKRHPKGVAVTIDEVQKLDEDDVSAICNAFQMASRKGHNVILVVAGLPFAHAQVIGYAGCTYMRRARHVELELFSWDDAEAALATATTLNPGLLIAREDMVNVTRASYGHPYMIQLLGYYLITLANERALDGTPLGSEVIADVVSMARLAYESRSLRPLVSELSPSEAEYLTAMAQALDDQREARTADVAAALGREAAGVGYLREALINSGVIVASGRGRVMFNIPYLADYLLKVEAEASGIRRLKMWGV